LING